MWINRFVLSIFLIVTSCQCGTDNRDTAQKSVPRAAISDTAETDTTTIGVELLYRFKGDDFAKEMQDLLSEYFSLIVGKKVTGAIFG